MPCGRQFAQFSSLQDIRAEFRVIWTRRTIEVSQPAPSMPIRLSLDRCQPAVLAVFFVSRIKFPFIGGPASSPVIGAMGVSRWPSPAL